MASKQIRLLANAAEFPFLYEQAGRTVTESDDLLTKMPLAFIGGKESIDFGVPQLLFCENVLPYAKGLMSVSFGKQVEAISPATVFCDQAIQLRDASENQFTFAPAKGANYVLNPTTLAWTSTNPFVFVGSLITRAYVNGRTFVCYEKNRILEFDSATQTFLPVVLTLPPNVTMANIRGIGGASNYLVFFTDIAVYWCSPLNIFEFNDINQGAGQQTPIDIKGQITAVLPLSGGFIVYTARNAIGATFTNNALSPFVFREITNCGGVSSWEKVTADANDTGHYIWGSNGLQLVGLQKAETIFPQVTDFLVGGKREIWNPTTKVVDSVEIGGPFSVKLSFLAGRYLVISYGQGKFDFDAALIFDTSFVRWGKIAINHSDTFMYTYPTSSGALDYDDLTMFYADLYDDTYDDLDIVRVVSTPPKRGIDFTQVSSGSLALFGHIQQRRSKNITILGVELEGLKDSPAPQVTLLGSETGYGRDAVWPLALTEAQGARKLYQARQTAVNFDVAIEGTFVLSTALVEALMHGYR
jgi:hypothetical protein